MNSIPMSTDLVERVARAICEADGKRWRTRDERPSLGMPADYDFDALNNGWRHKARAALEALPIGPLIEALEEWRRIHLLLKNGESVGGLTIEDALEATDAALSRAAPENNDG